jgi:DNA helicase-2/ATP-dependent DNA helicase PcrA
MDRKFLAEYQKLNAEQKRAVDAIDGPVLVIAGPGTGKTQLLGMRVANILQKTDTSAASILCLTFTNKSADNMKRRLLEVIGADAQAVTVKTFHGLAADIMNRYPQYFWRGARLSIAPDAVQLEIIQQIMSRLPGDHPMALKFAGQFTLIDDAARSINLAKEAGLTPDKLRALIAANLEYIELIESAIKELAAIKVGPKTVAKIAQIVDGLPEQAIDQLITPLVSLQTVIKESFELAQSSYEVDGKTTPLSKWKARWLQKSDGQYGLFDERKRNDWWLAVADVYERYRNQLHARGYYDYADMLVETISQVEQNSDLRFSLQEQLQYVLIDEFQDTNAAQLRLAHLIADHEDLANPNIMAVGDDDQSIFKFQGAELSNMLGFTRQYPATKLIVLTDNYRSTQTLLDSADSIIAHAQYRLVNRLPNLSKKLRAAAPPSTKSLVEHRVFRSREEHLDGLADTARKLLESGQTVAVLARSHNSLRDMAMLLNQNGVPIAYEQSNNILEQPAIEQLYLILKLTALVKKGEISSVNELLSLTLRHPMWNVDPKVLWQFAIAQQTKHDWLTGMLNSKGAQLAGGGKWLERLTALSASEPLAVVVEFALGLRDDGSFVSPIKTYFFLEPVMSEAYVETLSAVQLLRSLIAEFRSAGVSKVEDFVRFIDLMIQNNKIISDSSPFVSGEKCVELLSVHKAKGLEFDTVIVIDATSEEWSPRAHGRVPPANLPLRPAEDDTDDYVRLMYVAATRARHTLLFGSYQKSHGGEDVMPAISLSQIPLAEQKPKAGKELVSILEQALLWPNLEQSDERALLKPRLETYSMNASNLINFLDITRGGPALFKERNLLRLPGAKSPAAAMGSAVHAALEEAQLLTNAGSYRLQPVLDEFQKALLSEGLPEADYKKKLADGRRIIKRFIDKHSWEFVKGARPEYKLIDIYCNDAKLSGTLDVLDTAGEDTLISDYKTGQPLTSWAAKSGPAGLKAWRYKLQLIFYALLIDLDPSMHTKDNVVCQIVYVESDNKSRLLQQYQSTKNDLTRLGSLIAAVWRHVMELNFPEVNHYSNDLRGIQQFEQDLIDGKI